MVQTATVRAGAIARPYSDDLRWKLLEAFDQGKGAPVGVGRGFRREPRLGVKGLCGQEAYRANGEAKLSAGSQAPDG
jgi:hypothetical protein